MILVGQFDSPFVRRVAITMNHYGLSFERKILSVFTDFEKMLAINPLGKVPALQLDDGEYIFDSRMIIDYLDRLFPEEIRLIPSNPEYRIQVLRTEAIALGLAEKCYERGIEFSRRHPDKIDLNWAERLQRQIVSALFWLESQNPAPWLCGEVITQADISCAVAYTFLREKQQIKISPGAYPALEAHCNRCEALPEFKMSAYSAKEAAQSGWKPPDL